MGSHSVVGRSWTTTWPSVGTSIRLIELEQGSFAAAAATEEHQGLAGIDRKADSLNNRVMNTTVNAVCHILKLNGRVNVI